jgi:hypothetical protein
MRNQPTGDTVTPCLGRLEQAHRWWRPLGRLGSMGLLILISVTPPEAALTHQRCHRTGRTAPTARLHLRGAVKVAPEERKGIPGVRVTLTGPQDCTEEVTTKTPLGLYEFLRLNHGTYRVTPAKEGCTFDPPTQTVEIARHSAQIDFVGRCP